MVNGDRIRPHFFAARRLGALLIPLTILTASLVQGPFQPVAAAATLPAPTVTDMTPTDGPVAGNTIVYLIGTGFTSDGLTPDVTGVTFGGRPATVLGVDSDNQVRVQAPNNTVTAGGSGPGKVHVVVTTPGGSATSPKDFVYHPEISAVRPNFGLPTGHDQVVRITGTGFEFGASKVSSPQVCFGQNGSGFLKQCNGATVCSAMTTDALCATAPAANDTDIYVDPPPAPNALLGTVDVYVVINTVFSDINTNNDGYTYVTPSASSQPSVTKVDDGSFPPDGLACCSKDKTVTISGTNFTGVDKVSFGNPNCGQAEDLAPFTVTGPQITATAPAHLAGTVDVGVHNSAGWSASACTTSNTTDEFHYDVPNITGLSPGNGPTRGGTTVTIDGAVGADQFNPNDTAVDFGGTPACSGAGAGKCVVTPTGSSSQEQVKPVSPPHPVGTVHVHVINSAGTSAETGTDLFTYIAPQPVITSIAPTNGPTAGGTTVTITGTGLTATDFYAVGDFTVAANVHQCIPANACSVTGDTTVSIVTPAHPAGTVDLFVHTGGGWTAATPSDQFTFGVRLPGVVTATSSRQYTLTGSDGTTWASIDATNLAMTVSPPSNSTAILGGNADLFTNTSGINQDIAIFVSDNGGADSLVGWKESGGSSGTFSPNAAFVQSVYTMTASHNYVFKLKWKTNKPEGGAIIYAGAGAGPYSPTRLTAEVLPTALTPRTAVSSQQYTLTGNNGTSWTTMDGANLAATVTPSADSTAVLGANVDLFTNSTGINQDVAIFASDNGGADTLLAWKESGGKGGIYSPNAAFVQSVYPMTATHTYVFKIK
ncbi:MAG TPA: IPT/TIG domain-containing protein, partial [Candidatus Dormibacteraeota bacterium]